MHDYWFSCEVFPLSRLMRPRASYNRTDAQLMHENNPIECETDMIIFIKGMAQQILTLALSFFSNKINNESLHCSWLWCKSIESNDRKGSTFFFQCAQIVNWCVHIHSVISMKRFSLVSYSPNHILSNGTAFIATCSNIDVKSVQNANRVLTVLRKFPLIWNAAVAGAILGRPFDSVCMFSVVFKCLAIRSIFHSNILYNFIQTSKWNHTCLLVQTKQNEIDFFGVLDLLIFCYES